MPTSNSGGEPGILQMIQMLLDQTSADAMKKAMQQALKDGTDPKPAHENLHKVEIDLDGIKDLAKEVGAALGIAFGVEKVIEFGRESVKSALEARTAWSQLSNSVKNVGVDYNSVSEDIQRNAEEFRRAGIMGDVEYATVLQQLIRMSGNYEKSLKNVGVVANVAAGAHMDLGRAAQAVGLAMDGNARRLKQLGIDVPIGADAVQYLADRFRGAAEATDPLVRQQKALHDTWDKFKETLGETILSVGNAQGAMGGLIPIIESVTEVLEKNKDALGDFGETALWAVKGPMVLLLMAFEGYARVVTAVMVAKENLLEINEKLWNAFRSPEEKAAIAKRIADTAALAAQTEAAADAAELLRKAITDPKVSGGEKRPSFTPGGAVKTATGTGGGKGITDKGDTKSQDEYFDEFFKKDQAVFDRQIRDAKTMTEMDETRSEGILHLLDVQKELGDYMDQMNLTWEQRAELMKEQKDVQDALIESVKKLGEQYGITEGMVNDALAGNWEALRKSVQKEAAIRAAWNVAMAVEEFARAWGWFGLGNPVSAEASRQSAFGHLAAAAKWGTLGVAATMAGGTGGGGGGGSGGSDGPTGLGSDAAGKATGGGTQVTIYVDGFDPKSTKQQDWLQMANEDIRQRYGEDSSITVLSGAAGRK